MQKFKDNVARVFHSPPFRWAILVGLFLVVLVGISIFFIFFMQDIQEEGALQNEIVQTQPLVGTIQEDFVPRLIDGILVPREEARLRPVALMIDNLPEARPLAGLSKAQLVFEAPVEAGITRFLAFYAQPEDVRVGPVRSARPYFVDWASEYGAVYGHVGGSEDGLYAARHSSVVNADDIAGQEYFWRDQSRPRPHNMYASTEKLREYSKSLGLEPEASFEMWKYLSQEDTKNLEYRTRTLEDDSVNPSIMFRSGTNEVLWKYDAQSGQYVRYELGRRQLDDDGSEIRAKNVIIVHMNMRILDEVGRRAFETLGQGEADVFYAGRHFQDIVWKKNSKDDRMKFFYKDLSEEFALLAGTTWIEIVPTWGVEWNIVGP